MIVLDSSALIAYLLREPGYEVVRSQLRDACISTVNLTETLARLERNGLRPIDVDKRLTRLRLEVAPFDREQAVRAAEMREPARKLGVSLADCCCMALALVRGCPVLTGDRPWLRLGLPLTLKRFR